MADLVVFRAYAGSAELPALTESPGPEPTIQALINALVDFDLAFERECQKLSRGTLDAASQHRMLKRLREQHRQRRAPYVQRLIARHEGSGTMSGSPAQSTSVG
jgi:hypothetical protein